MVVIDGQRYNSISEAPDLGSLVGRANKDGTRIYEGKYSDKDKLPTYDDLQTGSSACLSDNGSFKIFRYYADTKTWVMAHKD